MTVIDLFRSKLRLESLEEVIVLERSDSDDGVWRKHGYPAYVTPEVMLSHSARYSGRAADLWFLHHPLHASGWPLSVPGLGTIRALHQNHPRPLYRSGFCVVQGHVSNPPPAPPRS